jgi:hypothetical protein
MSWPSTETLPDVGSETPDAIRIIVVFPGTIQSNKAHDFAILDFKHHRVEHHTFSFRRECKGSRAEA